MDLEFVPGFTVLTGETGAGKSILIDALSLVLGERSDAGDVRAGCERAEISAEFDISELPELTEWLCENGFESDGDRDGNGEGDDDGCLLRRLIDVTGRSRSFINGRPATLQQLHIAGEQLVEIQGQHAHQLLMRAEAQRDLLDAFAGSRELTQRVTEAFRHWQGLRQRRLAWEQNAATFMQQREQLEWQANELAALNFSFDEWQALRSEHGSLANAASCSKRRMPDWKLCLKGNWPASPSSTW